MNIFYNPEKDSTIYSQSAIRELNFGKSEILELKNSWSVGRGTGISRILLQYNIPFNLENYQDFEHLKFYLELKITQSEELTDTTQISAFPISDYWQSGIGIGLDADPVYQPVNWIYKTDSEKWESEDDEGGGSYYTHIERCGEDKIPISCTYTFSQKTSDVNLDVTSIVKCWMLGDIPNNGFLIKFTQEGRTERSQSIKFYSSDTNTIYSPRLRAAYFDYVSQQPNTPPSSESGSLSGTLQQLSIPNQPTPEVTDYDLGWERVIVGSCETILDHTNVINKPTPSLTGDIVAKIKTIRKKYFNNEQIKFNLSVRHKHPIKTFSDKATYSGKNIVDVDMFYSIRDAETQEVVVAFDEYSRISNDSSGHFFILDLSGLHVGRYYVFRLLVSGENGNEIFEDTRTFEIGS